jgi:hypothetical protein
MSIRDNILEVKKTMLMELLSNDKTTSSGIQELAIAAINAGPGSEAWRAYMSKFAENDTQLQRLMASNDDPGMDRARAYLIADGPCGTETVTNFGNNTTIILDTGLADEPNA